MFAILTARCSSGRSSGGDVEVLVYNRRHVLAIGGLFGCILFFGSVP